MQTREITIAELPGFVQSELWQQLQPKPITQLRAISQSLNPRANADDVALIIASEGNRLLALAGILPNYIHGRADQKAASNTCWWADAQKGRQIAFPLLMKAFALSRERMFMTDLTPHTRSILEKTGRFEFPDVPDGIRGFLKFNLHEVLPAKMPSLQKFRPLLRFLDHTVNLLFLPFRIINQTRFKAKGISMEPQPGQAVFNRSSNLKKEAIKIEILNALTNELHAFIEAHSGDEFIRRSGKELEWIIQHPWIITQNHNSSAPRVDYPFSHLVKSFEQYFLHLSSSEKTIGLLLISIRDGHMKVPYAYFDQIDAPLVLKEIYRQAVLKNAVTLTLFLPELVHAMQSAAHPFIFRKPIKRLAAVSKLLSPLFGQYPRLQDGDGDVVFT
jgi:hypothetical protein